MEETMNRSEAKRLLDRYFISPTAKEITSSISIPLVASFLV
jgi:hypothetical protein